MTATATSVTEFPRTAVTAGSVWRTGAIAGVGGAVALFAYGAIAQALSIPMKAAAPGASSVTTITPVSFAFGVVFCTLWGTVLAVVLNRRAARPARTFLYSALALTVVSLGSPLSATHIAASTRITLVLGHLLAAAIVIPILTRRLARR
jgi:hypothetical protein